MIKNNIEFKRDDDEEKILMEREYLRHEAIKDKIKDMDEHQKFKDIGYKKAYLKFKNDINLMRVLLGFFNKREDIYEIIYDIIEKDEDLYENIIKKINQI